jgi:periplasmic protein TonB
MFEGSLLESTPLLRTHNRWPAAVSFAAQLSIAAIILTIPLLHPEILPLPQIVPATLTSPKPPVPEPPPVHVRPETATHTAAGLSAPTASSVTRISSLLHSTGAAVEAPPLGVVDLGRVSELPPGIKAASPDGGPHITVASPSPKLGVPVRVSNGVSAGLLIEPIRPEYPEIARLTHTEGSVVIDATISRMGAIESAHVLSGPAILQQAALDAVRRARYRPYLLNGEPIEVQTCITVHFKLGD